MSWPNLLYGSIGRRVVRLRRSRLLEHRSPGQIIVLAALAFVPMIGFAGISVDFGNIYMRYRMLQTGADAAALAGMRVIASGVPGTTYTTTDVANAISTHLTNNAAGATVTTQQLLWGTSSNADQCLATATPTTVNLTAATTTQLWTAHCLQVTGNLSFNTWFVQIVGVSTFNVQATSTVTAAPVTAMSGLRPITIPDTGVVVNGLPTTPWGPQWSAILGTKTCTEWQAAPVPHPIGPDPPCPGGLTMAQYKGLVNFLGPPSPPAVYTGNSNATGCHYEDHPTPSNENQEVGWDNPTHAHAGIPWTGGWTNSVFQKDTGYTNCSNSASFNNAVGYWAANGYGGVISAGPAASGQGDFFTLNNGNLGNNFHGPLSGACTGPTMVIYLPVFDAMADPNHNTQTAVHLESFAALQITCPLPNPSSSVTGTIVQAPVPASQVKATGGSRQQGASNVTLIKLVG